MKQLKKRYKTHRHRRLTETQKTDRERNPPQKTEDYDSQKLEFLPRILILNFLVLLQLPN